MKKKKKLLIFAVAFSLTAVLIGVNLLTGCKKNVGSITNIVKYDISGYVLISETSAAIEGVTIYLDSLPITKTNDAGKYVIPKLKPGSYLIKAVKDGYTNGHYNLTVSADGVIVKAILLKKLTPTVAISISGGSITATNTSGSNAASLAIASGTLTSNIQISVTSISNNEAPKELPATGNQILGSIVSINATDPTLNFTQGVTLTFNLVAMQKPGDALGVQYFNEKTNVWEPIQNAIVNSNGITASVLLHHFSTYCATITGTCLDQIDKSISTQVVATSANYNPQYEWQSVFEYRQNITNTIDNEWLYTTVEGFSKIKFSSISYGTGNSISKIAKNISTISAPPAENPDGYRNYPKRYWELVKYTNWVHNIVSVNMWNVGSGSYVTTSIPSWYQICSFVWIWRPDDSFSIPVIHSLNPPVTYVVVNAHNGGIGG